MNTSTAKLYSYRILAALVIGLFYITMGLSVDNNITDDDVLAINSLEISPSCAKKENRTFENEIKCLKSIQLAIQSIGTRRCASSTDTIEPSDFLKRGYGCCFDRARFIEKSARYYGFETRHVFLIHPYRNISMTNALPLGQLSHATSEILTKKGWLGIDSNEPFLLVDSAGNPNTYSSALENIERFPNMAPRGFYSKQTDVIYGLYSRHGNFHGANIPGPEYVLRELLYNFE